jgi:hypothetical protein
MKAVLLGFAYFGWILTLITGLALMADIQPMFGSKVSYNDVFMFALISIASSGVWLVVDRQQKNESST